MIWLLLGVHVGAIAIISATARRLGRHALLVAGLPSAATTTWAITRVGDGGEPPTASLAWVDGLDLELAFRVTDLGLLMTLVVSGIGTLVFVYAHGYFSPSPSPTPSPSPSPRPSPGGALARWLSPASSLPPTELVRFTTSLLAFATAMLGLVWADSVWTLFVFWELTSITSFLLVGHRDRDAAVRAAARRALLVTVAGGLAMLAGLVVLVDATGTGRLSEMGPVDGSGAAAAAVLLLVGAATKSAQVPFHMWLPGAMAAPTPVSAYLHAATMVKAGVLLVAVAGPIVGDAGPWRPLGLTIGVASMLWGAISALRHDDGKLILAWGTISQLGLMITLLAIGRPEATFAAVAILVAHALFKAPLFMVVGEIDLRAGTRNISELNGLWRSMPVALAVAVISGASMAGVPPLLGFAAKEAAIEAAIGLDGLDGWVVGGSIVVGSALTVAYTTRLLLGLFGPGPGPERQPTVIRRPAPPTLRLGSLVLAVATVAGYAMIGVADGLVGAAAEALDPAEAGHHLHRWPGFTVGLAISAAVVASGAALGHRLSGVQIRVPAAVGADVVDQLLDGAVVTARRVIGRDQHGSLPVYVATMAATAAAATTPFLWDVDIGTLRLWDRPAQGALAALIIAASSVAIVLRTRLAAALSLGAVGIGVSGLFVVHGAPDLVLTQLLVETVIVVGFVVGLGHLRRRFPHSGQQWVAVRIMVSAAAAIGIAAGLAAASSAPTGHPPVGELVARAVDEGGGGNVVNVILTDVRGLDTLGEIVVLAVAAIGIAALAAAGPAEPAEETR